MPKLDQSKINKTWTCVYQHISCSCKYWHSEEITIWKLYHNLCFFKLTFLILSKCHLVVLKKMLRFKVNSTKGPVWIWLNDKIWLISLLVWINFLELCFEQIICHVKFFYVNLLWMRVRYLKRMVYLISISQIWIINRYETILIGCNDCFKTFNIHSFIKNDI